MQILAVPTGQVAEAVEESAYVKPDKAIEEAAAVFDDETNFLENVDRFPTGETRDWRLYLDGSNFFFVSGLQFRWRAAPKRSTEATTLVGRK